MRHHTDFGVPGTDSSWLTARRSFLDICVTNWLMTKRLVSPRKARSRSSIYLSTRALKDSVFHSCSMPDDGCQCSLMLVLQEDERDFQQTFPQHPQGGRGNEDWALVLEPSTFRWPQRCVQPHCVCVGGHTTVHPDRDGNQSATPKSFFIFTFRLKISVSSRHEIPPFFKLVSIHPCDENLLSADTVPDVRPSLKIFHIPYLRKKST